MISGVALALLTRCVRVDVSVQDSVGGFDVVSAAHKNWSGELKTLEEFLCLGENFIVNERRGFDAPYQQDIDRFIEVTEELDLTMQSQLDHFVINSL